MEYISHTNIQVIKDLLERSVEVCGHLIAQEKGGYLPYLNSVGEKDTCQHSSYSKYIWHTHPENSKGYPSVVDIVKVIKNRSIISKSFIFTTWGIWCVSANPSHLNAKVLENIKKDLENYLADIYFATKKGKVLTNEHIVKKIINSISRKINSKYYIDLGINFKSWEEIPCIYNIPK